MPAASPLHFDVLLRTGAAAPTASVETIDSFRPDPAVAERCRRWFVAHGAQCTSTSFGLAGSASKATFARIFTVPMALLESGNATEIEHALTVPAELSGMVEQVTLPRPPEFFR